MLSSEQIDSEILIPIYKEIKNEMKSSVQRRALLKSDEAWFFTRQCILIVLYMRNLYNRESNIDYPFLGYRKNKFSSEINHYVSKKNFASTLSNLVNKNKFTIGLLNPSIETFFELSKMLFQREKINFCFPKSSSIKIS